MLCKYCWTYLFRYNHYENEEDLFYIHVKTEKVIWNSKQVCRHKLDSMTNHYEFVTTYVLVKLLLIFFNLNFIMKCYLRLFSKIYLFHTSFIKTIIWNYSKIWFSKNDMIVINCFWCDVWWYNNFSIINEFNCITP